MQCNNEKCDLTCNRCEEELTTTTEIDAEFVRDIQQTAQALLRAAAEINNAIRLIERECPHADNNVILAAIKRLSNTAGDLSEQWSTVDLTLAGYNLLDAR